MNLYLRSFALIAMLVTWPLQAKDWQAGKGSALSFSTSFQGEAFSGEFKRFTPKIRFDPNDLLASRFDVSIDLASVDSRNAERDDTLKTGEFFDVGKTVTARYTAAKFTALGSGRYRADGQLSLRGITKPVALVFNWKAGQSPVLTGEAMLNRLDFKVGTGDWSDTGVLPNAVKVTTRLILAPKVAPKP